MFVLVTQIICATKKIRQSNYSVSGDEVFQMKFQAHLVQSVYILAANSLQHCKINYYY